MKYGLYIALICVVAGTGVFASELFQCSLTPDIALHSRGTRIEGFALSIWGENPQTAFALGFVNGSRGDSVGFSLGLLNYSENYTGIQWGPINYCSGHYLGWQNGMVNYSKSLKGLQTGFLNYAKSADVGVQIGLINLMAETEEWFSALPNELAPAMIFVNWRF